MTARKIIPKSFAEGGIEALGFKSNGTTFLQAVVTPNKKGEKYDLGKAKRDFKFTVGKGVVIVNGRAYIHAQKGEVKKGTHLLIEADEFTTILCQFTT